MSGEDNNTLRDKEEEKRQATDFYSSLTGRILIFQEVFLLLKLHLIYITFSDLADTKQPYK